MPLSPRRRRHRGLWPPLMRRSLQSGATCPSSLHEEPRPSWRFALNGPFRAERHLSGHGTRQERGEPAAWENQGREEPRRSAAQGGHHPEDGASELIQTWSRQTRALDTVCSTCLFIALQENRDCGMELGHSGCRVNSSIKPSISNTWDPSSQPRFPLGNTQTRNPVLGAHRGRPWV